MTPLPHPLPPAVKGLILCVRVVNQVKPRMVRVTMRALGLESARRLRSDGFSSLFPAPLRQKLVRVNVRGDGQCGAHVLAILDFALRRRVSSPTQIRRRIYELACSETRGFLPTRLSDEFARTFRRVSMGAYLNDTEIVLFLHSRNLHAHILTHTRDLFVQSFRAPHPIGHAFLIFSHGCHWEILARSEDSQTRRGFSPVWSVDAGNALLMHLHAMCARFQEGAPPRTTYAAIVDGVPLFRIDADDRIWV